ncbi:4Fe-4S binding protein [Aquisalimonas sp. 2447]|uniref:4Fe-4S binding protein n=1 Tax=Aquisalimonas sp. 2447 TaxID=2740807 RepID=UPI0014325CD0|nr:4Fe-4S binding protein [Aquisalimonas sp. 2447]QIT54918.1 4Fe-4S binding protein [Aquisalimonas sp. 2447]
MANSQPENVPLDGNDPRVRLADSACLPRRTPLSACQACADTCPVGALTVTAGTGPELTGDCTGCGACAVACPTEALSVDDFPNVDDPAHTLPPVRSLECMRVPGALTPEDALRVPCLAGLHEADMLAMARAAGPNGLTLMDRGWCSDCPARGDWQATPVDDAQRRANQHLAGSTTPPVTVTRAPLPEDIASPVARGPELRRGNSRRQLLQLFSPEPETTKSDPGETGGTADPRQRITPQRRLRLLAERRLVAAPTPPPAPRLEIDGNCCNTGICAALCPTKALARTEADDGLEFEPDLCIRCGLCAAVCPQQAITIHAEGGTSGRLTNHRQATCRDCDRRFSPASDDATHCEACEKSRGLGRAAFI